MSAILSAVGDVFAQAILMVKTLVAVIAGGTIGVGGSAVTYTAQPLLLLFIVLPLVGLGIGLFRRLINVN